ncbi:5'-nucleotidase C-terminal domain-containing protein [Thioclava sp.]|uniref:5'-nucleotidase C-terminal domain-containing protein n=1 Tax=Thioclava sp. TaxID=1933450 RepID=UPI003AA9D5CC
MEGLPFYAPQDDTCAKTVTLALRVLETTDLHGHVRAYDYFTDRASDGAGLAALAGEIAQARRQSPNCLLFDNGDFMQGTPLTQLWGEAAGADRQAINPMIAAMNTVGYDAGTLGNHEFDFGLEQLNQTVQAAHFPIVSANLELSVAARRAHPALVVPPWVMLEREMRDSGGACHRLRIAVIGFLPKQPVSFVQSEGADGFGFCDSVACARMLMEPILAAKPDLVIALAHTGVAPLPPVAPHCCKPENTAVDIAAVDGIDVILAGHDHQCFPDPKTPVGEGIDPIRATLNGKPALNAGAYGDHLGVLDLTLEKTAGGPWHIARHRAELRKPRATEAPAVIAACEHAHHSTLAHIRREIGTLESPLHSYFALLGADPCLTLFARAQMRYATRALAWLPEAELPLLCAASSFKAGGRRGPGNYVSIAPGPLRINHIDDLYLFNNTLAAIEISGAELRKWLEHSARSFHQIPSDSQDSWLRDKTYPSYNFDVIFGVTYEFDISRPALYDTEGNLRHTGPGRVRDLRYQGQLVTDKQKFVLLSSSYRLAQCARLGVIGRPIPLPGPSVKIRDLLMNEARGSKPLQIAAQRVWRFASMAGTSVMCRTAPDAINHLAALGQTGLEVSPLELDEEGFLQLRIAL